MQPVPAAVSLQSAFHPPTGAPGPNPPSVPGGTVVGGVGYGGVRAGGSALRLSPSGVVSGCCAGVPGFTCTTYVKPPVSSGFDPADKVLIGDVTRWYSGGLADKVFINTIKAQGAMEALAAIGVSPYSAVTKVVGPAQAVVSRVAPDGQQGVQSYLEMPYNKAVPATGALSTAPLAATGGRGSGW
jgi:hypothetical protein